MEERWRLGLKARNKEADKHSTVYCRFTFDNSDHSRRGTTGEQQVKSKGTVEEQRGKTGEQQRNSKGIAEEQQGNGSKRRKKQKKEIKLENVAV